MSDEEYKFLRKLTYGTYNELFEVIDEDGIRKPVIRTTIRNVEPSPKGDKNFNKEFWTLEIDWRLADRLGRQMMGEYEIGEIPPEQLEKQKRRYAKDINILSKEDKVVADKAAKLIARDYGEVIKKLENE